MLVQVYIIRVNDDANNDSDGNEDEENDDTESDKEQEENVSEAKQLRSSGKRKGGGNFVSNLSLAISIMSQISISRYLLNLDNFDWIKTEVTD